MDKYFDKLKDENYKKYILPLEQADEAMRIAEAIFQSDCVLRKEMYYGVQEYQKEFLLNLATDKDFLALKPRQCGVTDLLAAHIAAKIIRHDCGITYSNDKLNILMVFANAQLVDEFVKSEPREVLEEEKETALQYFNQFEELTGNLVHKNMEYQLGFEQLDNYEFL